MRAYMSLNRFLPTKTFPMGVSAAAGLRAVVNASIACVRASAPDPAVSIGGHVRVSSGSQSATAGIRYGLEMPTFTARSGSANTATGVTSEPVPAVVGMAMTGMIGPGTRNSP